MTEATNIVDLSKKRDPVKYTIHLTHHWDGKLEIWVDDVSDTERSRESIAWALDQAAAAMRSDAKSEMTPSA